MFHVQVNINCKKFNVTATQIVSQFTSLYMPETLHQKLSFPLRISSVNVTKSAVSCGFGHIYYEILNEMLHFLCSEDLEKAPV